VVGVGDAELEMIEEDDTETTDEYVCQNPKQAGKYQGINQEAGKDCPLWEEGRKGLDDHIAKMLAAAEERLSQREEEK
jgi:hypothetical protein